MQSSDNDDGWLANIEEQYLQAIDAEPDYERQYSDERDSSIQKVWGSFQESATSIALLYKGKYYQYIFSVKFTENLYFCSLTSH